MAISLTVAKWALIVLGVVFILALLGAVSVPASAQEGANATDGEAVAGNPNLVVVDYGYSDGQGFVTLHAETRQEVAVYDPTTLFTDGPVVQKDVVVPPDATRTVSIQLGTFEETRAIAVRHDGGSWAEPVQDESSIYDDVDWGVWHVAAGIVVTALTMFAFWYFLPPIIRRMIGDKEGQIA